MAGVIIKISQSYDNFILGPLCLLAIASFTKANLLRVVFRVLRFADDIVLLAKDSFELESMVGKLMRASKEVGLSMNLSKTKIMSNIKKLADIKIGDSVIEKVNEYR